MKPDVIVTWPTGYDYPWWRWQMTEHRKKFNQIFVVFHKMGYPDFRGFLYNNFKNVFYINMPEPGFYWRHNAINLALNFSKNPWIWFTEMDFFVKEDFFFVRMFEEAEKADGVGFRFAERIHPACLLVKREAVDRTDKFFDPAYYDKKPGEEGLTALLDHFVVFTWQLDKVAKIKSLKEVGLFEGQDFYHMEDLTHNYDRVKVGEVSEIHNPRDFLVYNAYSRTIPVPKDQRWTNLTYLAESLLSPLGLFLNA
jgi:hypothetical protein